MTQSLSLWVSYLQWRGDFVWVMLWPMSLKSTIALLRQYDLFAGLANARLEVIAFTAERIVFETGEMLFEAGEEAHEAYLILSGAATMVAEAGVADRREHVIGEGDLIGEMALLTVGPQAGLRHADVRAISRIEALVISRYLFQRLIQEFPEMAGAVAGAMTRRLAQTIGEMTHLAGTLGAQKDGIKR